MVVLSVVNAVKSRQQGCVVMPRLSSIPDENVLRTAYYGVLYPLLSHGIAVSSQKCKEYTQRLLILQEGAVRCTACLTPSDCCCRHTVVHGPVLILAMCTGSNSVPKNKVAAITGAQVHY
jgi:hypothetical protein